MWITTMRLYLVSLLLITPAQQLRAQHQPSPPDKQMKEYARARTNPPINSQTAPKDRGSCTVRQPFEARVAPERGERGVDPKPAGREVERHPEQRLELVERFLRL